MTDIHSAVIRSKNMAAIKSRNTKPELLVRKTLHSAGFRYRLHVKTLPGKPDVVLRKYKAVLFVNGCFWHGHDCHLFRWPKTRVDFWQKKIQTNIKNDREKINHLIGKWRTGIVWECALKGKTRLPPEDILGQITVWLKSEIPFTEIKGYRGQGSNQTQ